MKYLLILIVLFSACQPSYNLDENACVDECVTVEGTISDLVTLEPFDNLTVKAKYSGGLFTTFGNFEKAEVMVDANGFYSISFEIFNEEVRNNGYYTIYIQDDDKIYSKGHIIKLFQRRISEIEVGNTYVVHRAFPRLAYIKYDIDRLVELKDREWVELIARYELINGVFSTKGWNGLSFNENNLEDKGLLKVPAGIPMLIEANLRNVTGGSKKLKEVSGVNLETAEEYEFEVSL